MFPCSSVETDQETLPRHTIRTQERLRLTVPMLEKVLLFPMRRIGTRNTPHGDKNEDHSVILSQYSGGP